MASIAIEHVTKRFDETVVVDDVSLEVHDGEFLVLLGPSGCGKTTTLRMVAGLEAVSEGIIRIGDREAQDLHPAERDVAMVFQNYALYPHMSVFDNLAYGLRRRGVPRDRIEAQVRQTAELLQIGPYLRRKPAQLSGGQRQRVALGRAIVRHPAAFLMDEPLSNLDARLRVDMRTELTRLHADLGVTTMYVTHDQVEAMTMGHRIAVMDRGRVQQLGPPLELYRRPANVFVAGFLGTPSINLLPGRLSHDEGSLRFAGPAAVVPIGTLELTAEPADGAVLLGVRPQDVQVLEPDDPAIGLVPLGDAVLDLVEHLGAESFAVVRQGEAELIVEVDPDARHARGSLVALAAAAGGISLFDAASGVLVGGLAAAELPQRMARLPVAREALATD
jgi:ABC-type sugar transport system ATPase subunit